MTKARRENIEITSDRLTVSFFHLIISQPGEKLFSFTQPMMQSHSTQCLPFFPFFSLLFFQHFHCFPFRSLQFTLWKPLGDIIQPIRQGNSRVESRKKASQEKSDDERGGGDEEKGQNFDGVEAETRKHRKEKQWRNEDGEWGKMRKNNVYYFLLNFPLPTPLCLWGRSRPTRH